MHRIIMYADTSDEGLLKMEQELIDCLGENPSLDLEWVSYQIDHYFVSLESKWKIMFFLINDSKIQLVPRDVNKVEEEISVNKRRVLNLVEENYSLFYKIISYLGLNESKLTEDDYKNIVFTFDKITLQQKD